MRSRRTTVAAACIAAMTASLMAAGGASARTYRLSAGPPLRPAVKQLEFDRFFTNSVTVHRGDTVRWAINGFHDVAFVPKGTPTPAPFVPDPTNPVTGAIDAAGLPFWFNGQPNLDLNPQVALPAGGKTYNGTGYVNSGLPTGPAAPKSFSLKFTRTGTFSYVCLIHPGMTGTVRVVAPKQRIKSPAAVARAERIQLATLTTQALALARVKVASGHVRIGNDRSNIAWLRFFPANVTVKAGQTISFDMHAPSETHTVSLGPPAYTTNIEQNLIQVKPQAAGPPKVFMNPLGAFPSDPPPLPPYTGSNHGNGFENSGVLANAGPQPSSVAITFTKPGTYHFECVLHRGMDATVTVTA